MMHGILSPTSKLLQFIPHVLLHIVHENPDMNWILPHCIVFAFYHLFSLRLRLSGETRSDGKSSVIIGKSLFKKETDMAQFVGMKIETELGEVWGARCLFQAEAPNFRLICCLPYQGRGDHIIIRKIRKIQSFVCKRNCCEAQIQVIYL